MTAGKVNNWAATKYFPGRRCDTAQRRQYFELVYRLSNILGGTVCVERALGVAKGTLYRRASGKLALRYESLLAIEQLCARLDAADSEVIESFVQFLKGELHNG